VEWLEEKLVEPKDSKSREVKTTKSKTREKEVTPYSKWVKTLKKKFITMKHLRKFKTNENKPHEVDYHELSAAKKKFNTPSIYLAGGWSGWRDIVIEEFKDFDINWLDPRNATEKDNWFDLEVEMVKKSDFIIAWVTPDNKSGFGMTYEMGMAYALNKPYILINEKNNKYQWGMQSSGAAETFNDPNKAFDWLKNNWFK